MPGVGLQQAPPFPSPRSQLSGYSPSDVRCDEQALDERLNGLLAMSLPATLGAAAVEGAVGLLTSQKPLLGRWAPGRACPALLEGPA